MSPAEISRNVRLRLIADLRDNMTALDRLEEQVVDLLSPAESERAEWMRTLALAFEVDRYYTGVEAMLARIMRTLDGDVPSGGTWHLDLLRLASHAIPEGRPRLLSQEALLPLRELLKFRHLARHGYETEPDLQRMTEHGERVCAAHRALRVSIGEMLTWLAT